MQIPSQLCGIDVLFVEWIAIVAYLALGVWLYARWACSDDKPLPNWKFGDKPRRPGKSFEACVIEHIGGTAVFLAIIVFGLHALGIE